MKKILVLLVALILVFINVGIAEEVPFSEWIAGQDPVVTDVFAEEAPAPEVPTPEAPVPEAQEFEPIGVGSRGETVAQLQAKLIELGILNSKADGVFGPASEEAVKYTQKALGWEETGVIQTADELNTILALVPGDGVNLAVGTSDEWSEWMTPIPDQANATEKLYVAILDEKDIGSKYTCQIEIEFQGVTVTKGYEDAFGVWSRGTVDGLWEMDNIWDGKLVGLNQPPVDGVYRFISTRPITEKNVSAQYFNLGLKSDYWASGSYRVRKVKVEKGILATDWSISPKDVGDGINYAVDTSAEWSDWIEPQFNAQNTTEVWTYAVLGEKKIGDSYTCQVEVEFQDVIPTVGEESRFGFWSRGTVDDSWEIGNIWNDSLVSINTVPEDRVYKFISTSRITGKNMGASEFDLGFRCDFWANGRYRVRKIKVEKGVTATEWSK